jgi:hypothetical protein
MSEVARAGAAVDAHAGEAGVAEAWLVFLAQLANEEANRVRCRVWHGWCFELFGIASVVGCSRRWEWWSIRWEWWSIRCWTDVGPVCVQASLMSEVARARAVVDAHIGVAGVAKAWLGLLSNLSSVTANIPGLRAAGVKASVTAALSRHPTFAATSWAQDLVKRL